MLPQRPPRAKKRRTAISSSAKEDSTSTLSKSAITTAMAMDGSHDARQPLLGATKASGDDIASVRTSERPLSTPPSHNSDAQQDADMSLQNMSRKSQWIVLAVASGACAAFNGVFAKLTTTELTTSFAASIANLIGLGSGGKAVEIVIRAIFFALNLVFNGIMWTLFTKALARGTSTVQVSIINTSSNFMITAILGFFIFTESLPPLWWLGAAMLVAGNVIIGRREEDDPAKGTRDEIEEAESGALPGRYSEEERSLVGEAVELDENDDLELELQRKRKEDDEDILQLEWDDEELVQKRT